MRLFGSIETGGTKIVCAVGYADGKIVEEMTIPTDEPEISVPKIINFFKDKGIIALGIGSFGPVDTKRESPTYGEILNTPKLPWINFNLVAALKKGLPDIPMDIVTDVNVAAIGEYFLGAGKEYSSLLYITVGTGIGAGYMVNDKLLEGFSSLEMGHVPVEKVELDDYIGCCPYHGAMCLEGVASGTAIEGRWGKNARELVDNDEVWEMEAKYLSKAIATYIYVLSPEIIVMGGGIMKQKQLFKLIKNNLNKLINNYVDISNLKIVSPALEDRSGIIGGLVLASKLI